MLNNMKWTLGLASLLASSSVLAAEPGLPSSMSMVMMIVGLAIVVAVILGLTFIVRRLTGRAAFHGKGMKVIANLSLNTKERIVLIEIEDIKLLLGITKAGINTLYILRKGAEDPIIPVSEDAEDEQRTFSSTIKDALSKGYI